MPGRHINDQRYRLYMQNREKHNVPIAAAKSGFSPSSGYRIEADPRLPSEKKTKHERRRPDPLEGIFDEEVVPCCKPHPACDLLAFSENFTSVTRNWGAASAKPMGASDFLAPSILRTKIIICMYDYCCATIRIIVHTFYEDHMGRTEATNQNCQARLGLR